MIEFLQRASQYVCEERSTSLGIDQCCVSLIELASFSADRSLNFKNDYAFQFKCNTQPIRQLFDQYFPKEVAQNILAFQKFERKFNSYDVMGKQFTDYPLYKGMPQLLV